MDGRIIIIAGKVIFEMGFFKVRLASGDNVAAIVGEASDREYIIRQGKLSLLHG